MGKVATTLKVDRPLTVHCQFSGLCPHGQLNGAWWVMQEGEFLTLTDIAGSVVSLEIWMKKNFFPQSNPWEFLTLIPT